MQLQSGVKMGWTRLYDMAGISTLSSAIIVNNDWVKDAKNQDRLRRFLRASQRGWEYTDENRDEAAAIFIKHAPAFNTEIALLEINGTHDDHRTKHTRGQAAVLVGQGRLAGQPGSAGEVRQADRRRPTWASTTPTNISPSRRTRRRSSSSPYRPCAASRGGTFRLRDLTVELQAMSEPYIRLSNVGKNYQTKNRHGRSLRRHQSGHPAIRVRRHRRARAAAARPPSSRWWRGCSPIRRAPSRSAASASTVRRPTSASCSRKPSCSTGATCWPT